MAIRDLMEIKKEAESLEPAEQVLLAQFLMEIAASSNGAQSTLKATGNLSEFRGTIRARLDPLDYQRSIRSEWE